MRQLDMLCEVDRIERIRTEIMRLKRPIKVAVLVRMVGINKGAIYSSIHSGNWPTKEVHRFQRLVLITPSAALWWFEKEGIRLILARSRYFD